MCYKCSDRKSTELFGARSGLSGCGLGCRAPLLLARIAAAAYFVFILRKVIFFKGAPLLKERLGTKGLSQS